MSSVHDRDHFPRYCRAYVLAMLQPWTGDNDHVHIGAVEHHMPSVFIDVGSRYRGILHSAFNIMLNLLRRLSLFQFI